MRWFVKGLPLLRGETRAASADRGGENFPGDHGDRSVTGMVARDQMVGPWQGRSLTARSLPPASIATTAKRGDWRACAGCAAGFRRLCPSGVGEALTNIAATQIGDIKRINFPPTGWRRQATLVKMRACMSR